MFLTISCYRIQDTGRHKLEIYTTMDGTLGTDLTTTHRFNRPLRRRFIRFNILMLRMISMLMRFFTEDTIAIIKRALFMTAKIIFKIISLLILSIYNQIANLGFLIVKQIVSIEYRRHTYNINKHILACIEYAYETQIWLWIEMVLFWMMIVLLAISAIVCYSMIVIYNKAQQISTLFFGYIYDRRGVLENYYIRTRDSVMSDINEFISFCLFMKRLYDELSCELGIMYRDWMDY